MQEDIETKRAKLKSWLALHQMSRKEFAEKIGMSVTSINGWFSNTNIPDKKWLEIKALFEEQETKPEPVYRAVAFAVPDELAEKFKKAAEIEGLTLSEFVRQAALKVTREILKDE